MSVAERKRLLRLTKAELADLVLAEREARAPEMTPADIAGPVESVHQLANTLELDDEEDRLLMSVARSLAEGLEHGPEQSKAGIAKKLVEVVSELTGEREEEVTFVDALAARRAERAGADR